MYEAVANGLGIALARTSWSARSSRPAGWSSRSATTPVPLRQSYYLVYRKERRDEPAMRACAPR